MEPGIYGQPIQRTATVDCFMVSGYTTARLYARLPLSASGNPTSNQLLNYDRVEACFQETGGVNGLTFQVNETDDLASGPRTTLSTVTLVANGMTRVEFTPQAHFIEFKTTANGPAQLKAQMTSELTWTLQGFTKLDPLFPQYLVAGQYSTGVPTGTNLTISD
jgi:hypothetical protein